MILPSISSKRSLDLHPGAAAGHEFQARQTHDNRQPAADCQNRHPPAGRPPAAEQACQPVSQAASSGGPSPTVTISNYQLNSCSPYAAVLYD